MNRVRRPIFLVTSLVLHAGILSLIGRAPSPPRVGTTPILIEIQQRRTGNENGNANGNGHAPTTKRTSIPRNRSVLLPRENERNPSAAPATSPIDLFAPATLERALSPPPFASGSAPEHPSDTPTSPATDRLTALARLREMVGSAANAERLQSGRVDPRWRQAEREATTSFQPPLTAVTDETAFRGFLRQWLHEWQHTAPATDRAPRGEEFSFDSGFLGALNSPRSGGPSGSFASLPLSLRIGTTVEVTVDANGSVRSFRILTRSGRSQFDRSACHAVLRAIEGHGPLSEGKAVITRWLVEARLVITPPAALGFGFDESTGKVNPYWPMKKTVKGSVTLLAVEPQG